MESHPLPPSSSSPEGKARGKQPEIQNPEHHQPPDHAHATGGPDVRITISCEAVTPPAPPSASSPPTSPAGGPPPSPIDHHHHHDAGTSAASRPPPNINSPASAKTLPPPPPPPPPNSRWSGMDKWKDKLVIGPGHVLPPRQARPVVRFSTPPPVPYCGKGRPPTYHPFPRSWTPPARSSSGKTATISARVSQKPSSSSSGTKTSNRASSSSPSGKKDIKAGNKNQASSSSSSSSSRKKNKGKNKKRWGIRLGTILEEEEEDEEDEEDLEGCHGDEPCSSSNEPPPATALDDRAFLTVTKYCGCSIL